MTPLPRAGTLSGNPPRNGAISRSSPPRPAPGVFAPQLARYFRRAVAHGHPRHAKPSLIVPTTLGRGGEPRRALARRGPRRRGRGRRATGPPGGARLRGRAPPREHRRARPDTSRHGRCPRVSRPERVRVRVLAGLDGGTHRGTPGPWGGLRDARGAREVPRGDGDGRRSRVNGNGRGDVRRSRHFWRRGDDRRRRSRQFRERRRRRRVRFRARRSRRVSRRNPGGFQDGDASSEFLHLSSFRAGDRLRARGGVQ